jgi:hypothetical protein
MWFVDTNNNSYYLNQSAAIVSNQSVVNVTSAWINTGRAWKLDAGMSQ